MTDCVGKTASRRGEYPKAVMRLRVVRGSLQCLLECFDCAVSVAELCEGGAELVAQRRVVRCDLEALSEVLRRRCVVTVVERAKASRLLRSGAAQQLAQRCHQRIRWTDLD